MTRSARRPGLAAALVAAALTLAACAPEPPRTVGTVNGVPLGSYVLVGIGNGTVPLRNMTLTVAETSVTGHGPCNSFAAANSAELPAVALGPLQTSQAACDKAQLEQRYFDALRQASSMEYYGGVLRVKGPTWLIFERGVPAAEAATSALDTARANVGLQQ